MAIKRNPASFIRWRVSRAQALTRKSSSVRGHICCPRSTRHTFKIPSRSKKIADFIAAYLLSTKKAKDSSARFSAYFRDNFAFAFLAFLRLIFPAHNREKIAPFTDLCLQYRLHSHAVESLKCEVKNEGQKW